MRHGRDDPQSDPQNDLQNDPQNADIVASHGQPRSRLLVVNTSIQVGWKRVRRAAFSGCPEDAEVFQDR